MRVWKVEAMMALQTTWRGQTMSDRALDRRAQFLDAGFELLGNQGATETTVRAVSRRAGLSSKYFYETFANREDLLIAVHTGVFDGLREAVAIASPIGTLDERVHRVLLAAATYFEQEPRRARIFFRETIEDPTLRANVAPLVPVFVLTTAHQVGVDVDVTSHDATEVALGVSSLSGALTAIFTNWLDRDIDASCERIARYCTQLVLVSPLASGLNICTTDGRDDRAPA